MLRRLTLTREFFVPRLKYPPPLTRVEVEWEDIYEDVVGDAATASTAHRITAGYFLKKERHKKSRRVMIVTCGTLEIDEDGTRSAGNQSGWCSYPVGTVIALHYDPLPDSPPVPSGDD